MELVEQQQFDVVVGCENLADYTGLELLSEIEALCPATLRIFAARPESLRRLGKRLDLFGLLGTLSYPIEARKLVVALKVARTKLPARPKPPKAAPVVVRHIVLETEWDTGERLALLEQELEEAPAPERLAASAPDEEVALTATLEAPAPEEKTAPTPTVEAPVPEEKATPTATPEVSFEENPSPAYTAVTQSVGDESAAICFAANEESVEEPPPAPEVPVVPSRPYCGDLAANEEGFEEEPAAARTRAGKPQTTTMALVQPAAPPAKATAPQPGASRAAAIAKLAGAAATSSAAAKKQNVAKGPRPRKPTTPTAAQREAFQRALARRNAARTGGVETQAQRSSEPAGLPGSSGSGKLIGSRSGQAEAPPIDFSNVRVPNTWVASGFGAPPLPSQSLKDLARMATTKRPLPGAARARQKVQPKRGVVVVGSGIVAVLLVGVLTFELHRATPPVEHGRHAHAGAVQLFSPNSVLADTSAGRPQVFSAPAPQPNQAPVSEGAAGTPQPQSFDPDTAPPDPPPPPALEHPGPMEPPSMAHNGPPVGMQGAPDSANGWNSE